MLDAGPFEEKFTLDPMAWRPLGRTDAGLSWDYDGSDGTTIRFGDGTFGELPNDGDVFEVRYRVGRGLLGNVPVDTITEVDPAWSPIIAAATNPIAASGGADAETDEQIRRRAPFAFQNVTYRAVRPEDYNAAAQRLPWVQRAGTVFRWTGSWPTIFSTADPKNAGRIAPDEQVQLLRLLNRYRLAGYETYAPQPVYVSFDIRIEVCAKADAWRGDVIAGVRHALDPVRAPDGHAGFFHFDNFTLGTRFERSRLEAAIQAVPGVAGVNAIEYRRRGQNISFVNLPGEIAFAPGEIFRLDNNASHPERGSYTVRVEGGK
jgi:predicted phage baseplate assembly protein